MTKKSNAVELECQIYVPDPRYYAIVVFLVVSIVVVLINAIFYNIETRKGIKILLKRISN